ncbi:MAG TPA: acyloxyacyl hydrolase [Gemmatirosa sp.]
MWVTTGAACLVLGTAAPAAAQKAVAPADSLRAPRFGDRSLGLWVAGAPHATVGPPSLHGLSRGFYIVGVHAEWVLEAAGTLALSATADLHPAAVVTRTLRYRTDTYTTTGGQRYEVHVPLDRGLVYGAGISPFGLATTLSPFAARAGWVRGLHFAVAGSVGILTFTRNTPAPDSRRGNLTVDGGGGLELERPGRLTWTLGYRYRHFSNAGTAPFNPGLDARMLVIGVRRRR